MNHPNSIKYIVHFIDKERTYIVMELCRGNTLNREINIRMKK